MVMSTAFTSAQTLLSHLQLPETVVQLGASIAVDPQAAGANANSVKIDENDMAAVQSVR